jgi:hypothetical protein
MTTDTRLIPLSQEKFATVSVEDYDYLIQFSWHASKCISARGSVRWYAKGRTPDRKTIYMHRLVAQRAGLPESPEYDHKNRDGLCNTRDNIRPCTVSQNRTNVGKRRGTTSEYKGIYRHSRVLRWVAQIVVNHKTIYLGLFKDEVEAAAVYAAFALFFHGEFACFD